MASGDSLSRQKLRILCLHGYRQNGETFRQKLGAFRKVVKNYAELVFMSAPLITAPPDAEQRGWWFSQEDAFDAREEAQRSLGFERSIATISEFVAANGPFDGILGFSQGATMAAIMCAMVESGTDLFNFRFAVLVSGFKSRIDDHQVYFDRTFETKTLHVFGKTDEVIPYDMSKSLADCFSDPVVVVHDGGHYFPTSGAVKKTCVDFLRAMDEECSAVS